MPRLVPPVVPAGRMRHGDQPVLVAPGGLKLRPWLPSDATIVLAAERQARTNLRRELHALRAELPQVDPWLTTGWPA